MNRSCAGTFLMLSAVLTALPTLAADAVDVKRVDLVGRVSDDGGDPVVDANIVVIYKSWPNDRYRQQSLNARTNENGEFVLEKLYKTSEKTAFLVSVVKNGFALESVYVLNENGKELKPFDFRMTAARSLTMQLVDKTGNPLVKTAVAPRHRKTPYGDEHRMYYQSLKSTAVMTDAAGKVRMGYFRVGDEANIEIFAASESTKATFRVEDEDERRVMVDIKQRLNLTGTVMTSEGQTVAKATVLLIFKSWPNNRYRQMPLATTTNERGKFSFARLYNEGDRTAFLVTIVKDGLAMESQYVINQDGDKQDFEFKLSAAKKLNVQLVDKGGKPLADAAVFTRQRKTTGGDAYLLYQQSAKNVTQRTDKNGKLDLNLFEKGDSVELSVTRGGKSSTVVFQVGADAEQIVEVDSSAGGETSKRWQPEPKKATAQQIAWIRKSAIPFKTIDPNDEDFSDLAPLQKLIGDTRIVQLGEQSHGDGTCFETKARLIKYLHQEMGFDVLAFESGLFDCRQAWQSFQAGAPANKAAGQGIFGIWTGSKQVQPLIEYLSARANSDRPLELCGFDCQFTATGSREHLVKDLRQLVDDLQIPAPSPEDVQTVYAGLKQLMESPQNKPHDQKAFFMTIQQLGKALSQTDPLDADTARRVQFWIQNLRSINAHATNRWSANGRNVNGRDLQMANNLIWLANEHYQNRKIIVWAASFHIMRNPSEIDVPSGVINYDAIEPMGHHVAKELGDDVFTIGFTAYDGTAGAYFRSKFPIGEAPEGTLEGICHSAKLTNAIIPLRRLDGDGEWLNQKQFSRPLGYSWMKARWPRHFDAMVFNHTMKPSTSR